MNQITAENRRDSFLAASIDTRRQEVLGVLIGHRGMTAEEVADVLGREVYTIRPRLTELLEVGLVNVVGKRVSPRTGRKIAIFTAAKIDSGGPGK